MIADDPMPGPEALALVGLEDGMWNVPAELSGSEQQRIVVVRAIAKSRAIMLCDEPTGILDVRTGFHVLDALVDTTRKFHSTILLVALGPAIAADDRRACG